MVKKPVRQEHFKLLEAQIAFWDRSIEESKEQLKHSRYARNKNLRKLKQLKKRYAEQ